MPNNTFLKVKDLSIDLNNYRVVPQKDEKLAIAALIAIKRNKFIAIAEDLLLDGYSNTENIIILELNGKYIVKEGNRRISALKLIHKIYIPEDFDLPHSLLEKINATNEQWINENSEVPCAVYQISEIEKVNKIVKRIHGKGDEASRDPWGSVATARLNRAENPGAEPGLDLLEKYLIEGRNLNQRDRELWGGNYYLSILDQTLRKIYERLEEESVISLVAKYPKIKYRHVLETILYDIGSGQLSTKVLRDSEDIAFDYGIPKPALQTELEKKNKDTPAIPIEPERNDVQFSNESNNPLTEGNSTITSSQAQSPDSASDSQNNNTPTSLLRNRRGINISKNRKVLIPKTFRVPICISKVNDIRKELSEIDVKKHTNAVAVLFRVFVELSIDSYIDYNMKNNFGVSSAKSGKDLKQKINLTAEHLIKGKKADPAICQGIKNSIKGSNELLSLDTWHAYVHNRHFTPEAEKLIITWDNISEFMKILWENTIED